MKVTVVRDILEANERIARENRRLFQEAGVKVINLMSSPGSGKTTLLERTIDALGGTVRMAVVEGDVESTRDAERISRKGIQAVQINTGGACHLDGNMLRDALPAIDLSRIDLLMVENVGNLVCPAEFSLGEDHKVMVLSVTEGDDKPEKYPLMFRESSVLIINKVDLLPYVDCRMDMIRETALGINPGLEIFGLSCKTGEGIDQWAGWLQSQVKGRG